MEPANSSAETASVFKGFKGENSDSIGRNFYSFYCLFVKENMCILNSRFIFFIFSYFFPHNNHFFFLSYFCIPPPAIVHDYLRWVADIWIQSNICANSSSFIVYLRIKGKVSKTFFLEILTTPLWNFFNLPGLQTKIKKMLQTVFCAM